MSEEDRAPESPGEPIEIKLDMGEEMSWEQALKDLENYEPPVAEEAPAAEAQKPAATPKTARPRAETPKPSAPVSPERPAAHTPPPIRTERVPQLGKHTDILTDMSDIMMAVNKSMQQLKRFEQSHPYLVAPNVFRVWEDSLKETSILMAREFRRLRHDRDEKDRKTPIPAPPETRDESISRDEESNDTPQSMELEG